MPNADWLSLLGIEWYRVGFWINARISMGIDQHWALIKGVLKSEEGRIGIFHFKGTYRQELTKIDQHCSVLIGIDQCQNSDPN